MTFKLIISQKSCATVPQFWKAISILLNNPHVINRRILVSQKICTAEFKHCDINFCSLTEELLASFQQVEQDITKDTQNVLTALNISQYCDVSDSANHLEFPNDKNYLCINKLLPRNSKVFYTTYEFKILCKKNNYILYFHKSISKDKQSLGPNMIYKIQYDKNDILSISVQELDTLSCNASVDWLKNKLFPRLLTWMKNEGGNNAIVSGSLSLISSEKYAEIYEKLKTKYGSAMIKIWPENTNPTKFVYEDIAIATYLLLLWEKERHEKGMQKLQSFLDLGCGNGLLVYILSSEGHEGYGIDLRKRKIWDLFPPNTHLQVRTIIPSSSSLFPETDWLIGNHSDELTPWIPVIAARSSYKCRFFLLPCCAYEFSGQKYQRYSASKSQYSEYISYINGVCKGCGFKTQIDKLRIPSTKRICLIGWDRTYAITDFKTQDRFIEDTIHARSSINCNILDTDETLSAQKSWISNADNPWNCNFKPRETIEKTRNCTQLDKTLISDIINIVASKLLSKSNNICLNENFDKIWNAGGQINLGDIAKLIPSEMLKQLRNECGGLQTLLKNNGHIFTIIQGKVQFKIQGITDITAKRRKTDATHAIKVKPCWFHQNHPDGCPIIEAKCNFKH